MATFGDRRSIPGFELIDFGDRSTEGLEFCNGEGGSDSSLVVLLVSLLTLGVAGDALVVVGFSDKPDLQPAMKH